MTASDAHPAPALVLSGGGARAAYQAGALAAVAEIAPTLEFPIITGVSAGAINAVFLGAFEGPLPAAIEGLQRQWRRLTPDQVFRLRPAELVAGVARTVWDSFTGRASGRPAFRGILEMNPLRRFLEGCVRIDGIGRNIAAGRLRAVALSATSYGNGCTVSFVQGAPDVPMWTRAQRYATRATLSLNYVLASAAIPIIFPAIELDGGYFGDGSVRQSAPLAPAIHLGARRVLAIGMRAVPPNQQATRSPEYPSAAEVLGILLHAVFLDALDADEERLRRINRTLSLLPAGARGETELRPIDLFVLRPSRNLGGMAADYQLRLPFSVKMAVRAIGGKRARGSDLVSYLLFRPPYTTDLMDLGYHDTIARRAEIEAFLTPPATP